MIKKNNIDIIDIINIFFNTNFNNKIGKNSIRKRIASGVEKLLRLF